MKYSLNKEKRGKTLISTECIEWVFDWQITNKYIYDVCGDIRISKKEVPGFEQILLNSEKALEFHKHFFKDYKSNTFDKSVLMKKIVDFTFKRDFDNILKQK